MPVDPNRTGDTELPERSFEWGPPDVVGYHLALGAGGRPGDGRELRYVNDRDLQVLPTFVLSAPATFGVAAPPLCRTTSPEICLPGIELGLATMVQTGLDLTVHRPIPARGSAMARSRVAGIHDNGRDAILAQEAELSTAEGGPLCSLRSTIHARGEGGFGGRRPPLVRSGITIPDTVPDAVLEVPTLPQQALLYQRLCGETNPVHADPDAARRAGFAEPPLQGACLLGMLAKAVVDARLDGDATRVARCSARFAWVAFPGDTLRIQVWRDPAVPDRPRFVFLATTAERTDRPVLTHGLLDTGPAG